MKGKTSPVRHVGGWAEKNPPVERKKGGGENKKGVEKAGAEMQTNEFK